MDSIKELLQQLGFTIRIDSNGKIIDKLESKFTLLDDGEVIYGRAICPYCGRHSTTALDDMNQCGCHKKLKEYHDAEEYIYIPKLNVFREKLNSVRPFKESDEIMGSSMSELADNFIAINDFGDFINQKIENWKFMPCDKNGVIIDLPSPEFLSFEEFQP